MLNIQKDYKNHELLKEKWNLDTEIDGFIGFLKTTLSFSYKQKESCHAIEYYHLRASTTKYPIQSKWLGVSIRKFLKLRDDYIFVKRSKLIQIDQEKKIRICNVFWKMISQTRIQEFVTYGLTEIPNFVYARQGVSWYISADDQATEEEEYFVAINMIAIILRIINLRMDVQTQLRSKTYVSSIIQVHFSCNLRWTIILNMDYIQKWIEISLQKILLKSFRECVCITYFKFFVTLYKQFIFYLYFFQLIF
ncbi:unnamed protein product [Paramecium primaurelia]|uniref:Uncharacterized protein n=1 Tax=Paramecium primaurelia TaxID=5886 RepID=A0A8S1QPQ6_PARPR|nr:unnamed protein product [Paramecium primaurelia]